MIINVERYFMKHNSELTRTAMIFEPDVVRPDIQASVGAWSFTVFTVATIFILVKYSWFLQTIKPTL